MRQFALNIYWDLIISQISDGTCIDSPTLKNMIQLSATYTTLSSSSFYMRQLCRKKVEYCLHIWSSFPSSEKVYADLLPIIYFPPINFFPSDTKSYVTRYPSNIPVEKNFCRELAHSSSSSDHYIWKPIGHLHSHHMLSICRKLHSATSYTRFSTFLNSLPGRCFPD